MRQARLLALMVPLTLGGCGGFEGMDGLMSGGPTVRPEHRWNWTQPTWTYREYGRSTFVCPGDGVCYRQPPSIRTWPDREWADDGFRDLGPRRAYRGQGRFVRPEGGVTCDRRTSICWKGDHIDKTETRDFFGDAASRRADALRDSGKAKPPRGLRERGRRGHRS